MAKTMRRVVSVVAALAIALLMAAPFGAAPTAPQKAWAATGTITVNPPANTADGVTTTYELYKVFDATGNGDRISYSLLSGKNTVPDVAAQYKMDQGRRYNAAQNPHFIVDTSGNVFYGTEQSTAGEGVREIKVFADSDGKTYYPESSQSALTSRTVYFKASSELNDFVLAAIKAYVASETHVTQSVTKGQAGSSGSVEFANVDGGYYYITTSTGSVVMINSNNPNATVNDKNEVPAVDKKISSVTTNSDGSGSIDANGKNAIAQVGSTVKYQATVTFNKNFSNVKFHDTMETGLALNPDSVTITFYEVTSAITGQSVANYYTIKDGAAGTETAPDTGDTLTIEFSGSLANQIGGHRVTSAVVTYTATVTEDALTRNPDENTATVTYGSNNARTTESKTSVYDAKLTVNKTDGSNTPLAGAGFKLKRTVGTGSTATTQYYKYVAKTGDAPEHIEWVTDENQATEYVSGTDGKLYEVLLGTDNQPSLDDYRNKQADTSKGLKSFVGLPDGTYTLVESSTPNGYNTAADYGFTVKPASSTDTVDNGDGTQVIEAFQTSNLEKSTTVVNNAGSALPSTGGPGTMALYVVGGVLVVAAGVALIARRRMRQH